MSPDMYVQASPSLAERCGPGTLPGPLGITASAARMRGWRAVANNPREDCPTRTYYIVCV